MKYQHSFQVDAIDDNDTDVPRAVVLLLGWFGARTRHLSKYAELYPNCATVQAIAENCSVFFHLTASLDACALEAAARVANLVRSIEKKNKGSKKVVPVVIHAFSNGGGYVVERLELLILQAQEKASADGGDNDDDDDDDDDNANLLLLGERLQGEFFDSSPVYASTPAALEALKTVLHNIVIRYLVLWCFQLQGLAFTVMNLLFGIPHGRDAFWKHMATSQVCLRQAFCYSSADKITGVVELEALIEQRKQKSDDVMVLKFEDSHHVQHFRKHAAAYAEFVKHFLDGIVDNKSNDVKTK